MGRWRGGRPWLTRKASCKPEAVGWITSSGLEILCDYLGRGNDFAVYGMTPRFVMKFNFWACNQGSAPTLVKEVLELAAHYSWVPTTAPCLDDQYVVIQERAECTLEGFLESAPDNQVTRDAIADSMAHLKDAATIYAAQGIRPRDLHAGNIMRFRRNPLAASGYGTPGAPTWVPADFGSWGTQAPPAYVNQITNKFVKKLNRSGSYDRFPGLFSVVTEWMMGPEVGEVAARRAVARYFSGAPPSLMAGGLGNQNRDNLAGVSVQSLVAS